MENIGICFPSPHGTPQDRGPAAASRDLRGRDLTSIVKVAANESAFYKTCQKRCFDEDSFVRPRNATRTWPAVFVAGGVPHIGNKIPGHSRLPTSFARLNICIRAPLSLVDHGGDFGGTALTTAALATLDEPTSDQLVLQVPAVLGKEGVDLLEHKTLGLWQEKVDDGQPAKVEDGKDDVGAVPYVRQSRRRELDNDEVANLPGCRHDRGGRSVWYLAWE